MLSLVDTRAESMISSPRIHNPTDVSRPNAAVIPCVEIEPPEARTLAASHAAEDPPWLRFNPPNANVTLN